MKNNTYGLTVTSIRKYGFKKALAVFEKYNRKCSSCEATDCLSVHHIDGSGNTDHRNDNVDNLQLYCKRCHSSLHRNQRLGKEFNGPPAGGWLLDRKEYLKRHRAENFEERQKYQKEYNKEYLKKYYQKNKEKEAIRLKEWRSKHGKEYYRKYQEANKEKVALWQRNYKDRLKKLKEVDNG